MNQLSIQKPNQYFKYRHKKSQTMLGFFIKYQFRIKHFVKLNTSALHLQGFDAYYLQHQQQQR